LELLEILFIIYRRNKMSLKERIAEKENNAKLKEAATIRLYKEDKTYRADRLIEAWSKVPEIGYGLKTMPISDARNVAINLDRQTSFMQGLRESQLATALNDFTPENMLRLVRLAMPNIIRNKVFTEFALETTKDSIKYIRPFYSKTANGHPLNDKDALFNGYQDIPEDLDPWGYNLGGEFNGDDFRKALYEDTRDRANQELANSVVANVSGGTVTDGPAIITSGNEYAFMFKRLNRGELGISDETAFTSGKWGENGALYVDGYTYIYGANPGDRSERVEQQVIAIQDKGSGQFFAAPGFTVTIVKSPAVRDKFLVAPPKIGPGNSTHWDSPVGTDGEQLDAILASTGVFIVRIDVDPDTAPDWYQEGVTNVHAFGRYNSESDFEGNYLGEVEIRMDEYMFRPSPTTIGVSWSQLTEITLDTSFSISAEDVSSVVMLHRKLEVLLTTGQLD